MGLYRHPVRVPRLVSPSAVFAAFQAVSVSVPAATDLAYRRPKPPLLRLPKLGSAALHVDPPIASVVLPFPRQDAAYRRVARPRTRLPATPYAVVIPVTPIASISGTMSFTVTDLTMMIVIDRPAVTTWASVSTQTTIWKAPLS